MRDHDLPSLASPCDDDFAIVDVDPAGSARPVRDRAEWDTWFSELFATLDALDADTDSEILDHRAIRDGALGWAALELRQTLTRHGATATFDCVATLVWKLTSEGWREARWHASVVSADVPEELAAAAGG